MKKFSHCTAEYTIQIRQPIKLKGRQANRNGQGQEEEGEERKKSCNKLVSGVDFVYIL